MIQLIDHNFERHARFVPQQTPGMEVFRKPGLTYVNSGLSCDTFNILHISDGATLDPAHLERAVQYYRERELAYCIWVNQEHLTGGVEAVFHRLGINRQNEEVGMILDLAAYEPLERENHQLVKDADTPEMLMAYARILAANWNPPDAEVIKFYERTQAVYLDPANVINLLIYYHAGEPVSSLELFPSDRHIAGIYGFATLESYRGRGIGSTLFTFALNRAKALGYQQLILQASEDGLGIYKKFGFKPFTTYYEYA